MSAKPILFSGPMVRALLDGSKTQTRRVVKPGRNQDWLSSEVLGRSPRAKPVIIDGEQWAQFAHPLAGKTVDGLVHDEWSPLTCIRCPYGKPGDLLWVKETHAIETDLSTAGRAVAYRADGDLPFGWTPSIHMPRWASRLTLRITDVRVQRLKEIDGLDALAEGITREEGVAPWRSYMRLWNEINGEGAWQANPWVWAISFEVIKANVDQVLGGGE